MDPTLLTGYKPPVIEGTIELRRVRHIYPSRPKVVVMNDVDLVIPARKTTALVGASGSGKSTIVGLMGRFYDPVGGEVLLDGRNVQGLNLHWLRQQISYRSRSSLPQPSIRTFAMDSLGPDMSICRKRKSDS